MAVIAFGLFLMLPLMLLVASLGRTVVGMVRSGTAATEAPAASDAPVIAVVPALRPMHAPAGVAVLSSEQVIRPARDDGAPAPATAGASTGRRPIVIPAPAPVFTQAAVTRPIAPRTAAAAR